MKYFKSILLTSGTFVVSVTLFGQPQETTLMIENENRSAIMIVIEQPEKITEDALEARLERTGLKEHGRNGVIKYKGVTFSEISSDKVDLYAKVEKGSNNTSVVYMAVSKGYNNFANGTTDSSIKQNLKNFLQSFIKDANSYAADVDIRNQINEVMKDEKSYQRLLDEQKDLQKKKSNIENRLVEIQNDLLVMAETINKKKSAVQDAKAKKNNITGP
jgi:hypothetical protein